MTTEGLLYALSRYDLRGFLIEPASVDPYLQREAIRGGPNAVQSLGPLWQQLMQVLPEWADGIALEGTPALHCWPRIRCRKRRTWHASPIAPLSWRSCAIQPKPTGLSARNQVKSCSIAMLAGAKLANASRRGKSGRKAIISEVSISPP